MQDMAIATGGLVCIVFCLLLLLFTSHGSETWPVRKENYYYYYYYYYYFFSAPWTCPGLPG